MENYEVVLNPQTPQILPNKLMFDVIVENKRDEEDTIIKTEKICVVNNTFADFTIEAPEPIEIPKLTTVYVGNLPDFVGKTYVISRHGKSQLTAVFSKI
ncbi:hypothetical protein COK86_20365 [Bacillus cereus]|uniref:Uncharacterized protein n=1 Tax=Bacillus cereus TaxID=1396 RepID=A0A2B3TZY6_BACCE|nr:hypothetical protein [Bacillus cereus]PFU40150.1 hypothetical protein COK86_20365 [Bacillus cereus]